MASVSTRRTCPARSPFHFLREWQTRSPSYRFQVSGPISLLPACELNSITVTHQRCTTNMRFTLSLALIPAPHSSA